VVDTGAPAVARFVGARRRFDERSSVGPIDLELAQGRTTVLLGPSGCGKTTLLRMLNGLLAPDAGRVEVFGEQLGEGRLESTRRRMGYVIQEGGLFPHLSARDNATLLARKLGKPRSYIDERLGLLSALTRLDAALLERLPGELSGGQRQRVALLRALFLEPELVLLDEPLGALDPMVRAELQVDLKAAFRALETSVVMVTHDLGEAAHFADHVVLLDDGAIAQRGTIGELERAPASEFVERFLAAQRPKPRGTA
jgi:osmoprotectant transport system ATP-binding protein